MSKDICAFCGTDGEDVTKRIVAGDNGFTAVVHACQACADARKPKKG